LTAVLWSLVFKTPEGGANMSAFQRPRGADIRRLTLHVNNTVPVWLSGFKPSKDPLLNPPFLLPYAPPTVIEVSVPVFEAGDLYKFTVTAKKVGSAQIDVSGTGRADIRGQLLMVGLPVTVLPRLELPNANTDAGALARLFLAEVPNPWDRIYQAADARRAMQWMHRVLVNRLNNHPEQFMARGAQNLRDVIRGPNQIAGFAAYPVLAADVDRRIQQVVDAGNNDTLGRQGQFIDFVQAALDVANELIAIPDPCPTGLYGWRTAGRPYPERKTRYKFYQTLAGNDFYTL
jgi:hypothetical protein